MLNPCFHLSQFFRLALCKRGADKFFLGGSKRFYQDFFDAINLDEEFNLTAIYSGVLLCVSSFLLKQIALSCRGGDIRGWMLLSKVFLFLAFDEVFQVHDFL